MLLKNFLKRVRREQEYEHWLQPCNPTFRSENHLLFNCIIIVKKLIIFNIDMFQNYRWYVLAQMPHLVSLDMSAVTKADRATAISLFKSSRPSNKKKKNQSEH